MDVPLESWIPAIILSGFYLIYQRKNRGNFGMVSFLVAIYVAVGYLSVFSMIFGGIRSLFEIGVTPVLYLSLCLVMALWGFLPYRDDRFLTIKIENYRLFRMFENVLLVSSFLAIIFFLPTAVTALHGDIDDNRKNLASITSGLDQWGYVNTFFSLIATMFALNIAFAFLNLTPQLIRYPRSRLKAMALLLSSTVYIVYVFAFVGRDGVVLWIMTFIFLYLFFRRFIQKDWAGYLKKIAMLFSLLSLIPFLLITYARFSEYHDGELLDGLWMYAGDQVRAFNDEFLTLSSPQWGQINFSLLYRLFDPSFTESGRNDWFVIYTDQGFNPWGFPTFIGSFLFDFGYVVTPMVIFFIAIGTRLSLRGISKNGSITISQLLVFLLCSQIVLYGVFYFRQYASNLYIIAILILALIFKVSGLRKNSLISLS